jgi:hypothetical protein
MVRGFYDPSGNGNENFLYDENGDVKRFVEDMSLGGFIDYMFLSALQRRASAEEMTDLVAVYETGTTGNHLTTDNDGVSIVRDGRYDEVAQITFDYISRLPEFYYFRSVN